LPSDFAQSVCIALEYLLQETKFLSQKELQEADLTIRNIPIEEIYNYQYQSAKLANSLRKYLQKIYPDDMLPNILFEWRDACAKSNITSVRHCWDG
jgi:hypothetical protein